MNLFLPSKSITVSVQSLDDKRVNKMILETAQLLSTAIRLLDPETTLPIYKITHKNHPVSIWVRSTVDNYIYAVNYFKVICEEYTYRTGKVHKSSTLYPYFIEFMASNESFLTLGKGLTQFANCTEFKEDEVHTAYKKTLLAKWERDKLIPKWSKRSRPTW
jgi:hypothetical protein